MGAEVRKGNKYIWIPLGAVMTEVEQIHANAGLAVVQLGEASEWRGLGLNRESVAWVEGFIERQRGRADLGLVAVGRLVAVIGSFPGECIVRH